MFQPHFLSAYKKHHLIRYCGILARIIFNVAISMQQYTLCLHFFHFIISFNRKISVPKNLYSGQEVTYTAMSCSKASQFSDKTPKVTIFIQWDRKHWHSQEKCGHRKTPATEDNLEVFALLYLQGRDDVASRYSTTFVEQQLTVSLLQKLGYQDLVQIQINYWSAYDKWTWTNSFCYTHE